ncbi:MAG: hypothetical protein NTZ34_00845 [Chloroflexi bacterium]|nr:hypothetical protein [Chloroflexota bacterium]
MRYKVLKLGVINEKCYIISFMKYKLTEIKGGTVTSPLGFLAGATEAAVKYRGRLDLGILYAEKPCASAAVYTKIEV